jgi:hypothetical protein
VGELMKRFTSDESGVTSVVEFILTFVLASIIFTIFIMSINGLFLSQSKIVVGTNQFTDVGNQVGNRIVDIYLIVPDNGTIQSFFDIPDSIEGSNYQIWILNNLTDAMISGTDEKIKVNSTDDAISVNLTINGVFNTIPISGYTSSVNMLHEINYTKVTTVV